MANKKWTEVLKHRPIQGENVITASMETSLFGFEAENDRRRMDALMAAIVGNRDDRINLGAAIYAPILQQVPYVELYTRFFQQVSAGATEDVLFALDVDSTDVNLPAIVYSSHPDNDVFFNRPGYKFTRPTWQSFDYGIAINWNVAAFAGWNVLDRHMSYCAWELARQRDTAALAVVTTAIPTNHLLSHTGALVKSSVDHVIKESAKIGFPVKFAIINPGRLMEMQSWTWTMPTISFNVADQLVNNLFYGQYGGVNWFASPNAPANVVYFGGLPEQTGWHVNKGTGRTDSDVDIRSGEDLHTVRDPLHAWYVGNSGLNLWSITII